MHVVVGALAFHHLRIDHLGIDVSATSVPDGPSPNGNVGQGYQRVPVLNNAKTVSGGTAIDGTFSGAVPATLTGGSIVAPCADADQS